MLTGSIKKFSTAHYSFYDRVTDKNNLDDIKFVLHSHEHYEIYLFLGGDSNFIIEDKSFSLEPMDLFIIRKNEFHQVFHNTPTPYHRSYIWLDSKFFEQHNCAEYEEKFLNLSEGFGNKIPAKVVRSSGIYDVFMKFKKYTNDYQNTDVPVIESLIVELLHLIHHTSTIFSPRNATNSIQPVITYLNQNFTHNITLDMLQETFFISKYHLCRKFRSTTGMSVQEYIRKKRLAKARELKADGMPLGDIAIKVGFTDYSSFYRAYQKEFSCTPKEK